MKKVKRGFVIGKFDPPHKGHHFLIDTALENSDELHIIICEFPENKIPERKIDITLLIKGIYERILGFFKVKDNIGFEELITGNKREDKIMALMPLLYLDYQNKIVIDQKEPFGKIEIIKFKE